MTRALTEPAGCPPADAPTAPPRIAAFDAPMPRVFVPDGASAAGGQ